MRNCYPSRHVCVCSLLLSLGMVLVSQTSVKGELTVSPAEVEFQDAFARRQLLVSGPDGDLTRSASYTIANPEVATIDETGHLIPNSMGETEVVIRVGNESVRVPVKVSSYNRERPIDFATEIVPLLTRYGCNSGGCHGKATGQNGFKLSLFGFDPEFDYETLVNASRGRRLFAPVPQKSLLLTKAIGEAPHGGGKRLDPEGEAYKMLLSWVEAGAPKSNDSAALVTALRIEPAEALLPPEGVQQLRVIATLSDGGTRDVTRQADFSSNLDVVASVNQQGRVQSSDRSGEATIMARYMGHVTVFRAIRPHGEQLEKLPEFAPVTKIDQLAAEKWKKLGILPSPVADDATFLRRLTLDLCGRLPTVQETRDFLKDTSADKRAKLIDRLLDSPDYPAYFALRWGTVLRNSRLAGADQAAVAFHNWIKEMIARNRPYDEFVRGIVAASGEWKDAPAINWLWQSRDDQLHTVTADTAQLFLGIRLQCARCHHHPYERWGQDDYYGLAGFFTRLGRKSFGQPPPYFSSSKATTSEKHPLTGKVPEPKFLDGEYQEFSAEQDPRHALVDWMAQPENPFFAKAYVNRIWGHFLGRGLVNEVDDMRATNPASNPEILEYLAQEFIKEKFDMKHLIRLIVSSQVYQLSSEPRKENKQDQQNFARFYARRLIAEVFLDAVDQTCGTKTNFGNIDANARAVDLPHEGFGSYFLDTFDRPQRVSVCECERSPGATLAQVLMLCTSDEIENKLANGKGRISELITAKAEIPKIVEECYLAAYSRFPRPDELQSVSAYLKEQADLRKGSEDLLWTLLNSKEFCFNH